MAVPDTMMVGNEIPVRSPSSTTVPRVCIIGCGAVTTKKYLPALNGSSHLHVTGLADVDGDRARRTAESFGVPHWSSSVSDLSAHADIAVIAVPHHLHAAVGVQAMEAGLHLFVEKPLTTNMADAERLLHTGARTGRRIGVGLVRRQYASYHFVKDVLRQGWLGPIRTFDFREGGVYNWPVATLATFRRETAGGVLFDTGAHTLDLLLDWLGPYSDVEYYDDRVTGVEANCRLDLTLRSGARGTVELSRTRNLRNSFIIRGDHGEIEIGAGPRGPVVLRPGGAEMSGVPVFANQVVDVPPLELMRVQIEQFASALQTGIDLPLLAERTLEPIRLFDACTIGSRPLDLAWESFEGAADLPRFDGDTILVLGGTGFIGGRLVEVLAKHTRARVRVMARDFSKLAGVSRFNVEIVQGDVTEPRALAEAMRGCQFVVNCTFGRGDRAVARKVNVDAVSSIVGQAAAAGIRRVVHLSTVSAYGVPASGELTESSSYRAPSSFVYGHTKWQGEQAGFAAARKHDVDLRILQPTVVYGPGAPSWTQNPIRMLKSGVVVLVNGGEGTCNSVYVDDVVQAIVCALHADSGRGERFLVSGPSPDRWKGFYGAYEEMLGFTSTISMSLDELLEKRKRADKAARTLPQLAALLRDPALFKKVAALPVVQTVKSRLPRATIDGAKGMLLGASTKNTRAAIPARPVHIVAALDARFQASTAVASIDKAARLLDYRPRYDLKRGMARTAQWASWANLLS